MNTENTIPYPGHESRYRGRLFGAIVVGVVVLLLSGCDGSTQSDASNLNALCDTLSTFIQDFARQAVAAWLL